MIITVLVIVLVIVIVIIIIAHRPLDPVEDGAAGDLAGVLIINNNTNNNNNNHNTNYNYILIIIIMTIITIIIVIICMISIIIICICMYIYIYRERERGREMCYATLSCYISLDSCGGSQRELLKYIIRWMPCLLCLRLSFSTSS